MTAAVKLFVELRQSGATLRTDGVTLFIKPNPSDARIRDRVRQHKAGLISFLDGAEGFGYRTCRLPSVYDE